MKSTKGNTGSFPIGLDGMPVILIGEGLQAQA